MIKDQIISASSVKKGGDRISNSVLSREFIQQMKGIAIILMIVHHSFGFPSFYIDEISYPSMYYFTTPLAKATKICVSIYAFVTGLSYCLHRDKSFGYSIKKIINFLLSYWVVYVVLLVVALLCGYRPSISDILLEMIGRRTTVMCFCWYVTFYILSMLILPFYARLMRMSNNFIVNALASGCFYLVICIIYLLVKRIDLYGIVGSLINFFPVILSGFLLTKYHILSKIYKSLKKQRRFSAIFGIFFVVVSFVMQIIQEYVKIVSIGVVTAPLLLLGIGLLEICNVDVIARILNILGRYSMNIWFLHCLFYAEPTRNVCQRVAYLFHIPVLVVLWILLLCVLAAVPIDKIQGKLISCVDRLLFNTQKKIT